MVIQYVIGSEEDGGGSACAYRVGLPRAHLSASSISCCFALVSLVFQNSFLQVIKPLHIHVESAGDSGWVSQGDRYNPDMPSEAKPRRVQTSPDCTVRCSFTPKETGYIRKEQLLAFLHATFGSKKQYGEQVSVVKLSNTSKSACTHAQQTMNERWSFYAPRRVTYVSLRLKLHVCCVHN